MSTRVQWFEVPAASKRSWLERTSVMLAKRKYSQEFGWGFNILDARQSLLTCVFIEKEMVLDEVTDPFGEVEKIERVYYRRTFFKISTSWPHLQIVNGQRSLATIFTKLAVVANGFTAIPLITPPVTWLKFLPVPEKQVSVEGAIVKDVLVSPEIVGKVSLAGRGTLVQFTEIVRPWRHTIHTLALKVIEKGMEYRLDLTNDGRIKIYSGDEDRIVEIAYKALQTGFKKA